MAKISTFLTKNTAKCAEKITTFAFLRKASICAPKIGQNRRK
jgi:hypothetical protein